MAMFVIRNKRTGVVMGKVTVERPEDALSALAQDTDSSVEEIALSLGRNAQEAGEAIDIVEVDEDSATAAKRGKASKKWADPFPNLPRRWSA